MFSFLAAVIILILLSCKLVQRYRFASMINSMPTIRRSVLGTGVLGLIGVARMQSASTSGIQETLTRMCMGLPLLFPDGILCTWMGPVPYVFVMSAETAECVLRNSDLTRKGGIVRFLSPILGTGLFTGHGEKWRRIRKLLTPAFHFKILEKLAPVFSRNSKILLNKLQQESATNGTIHNIAPRILLCSLDVICETAMGEQIGAQSDPDAQYVRTIHSMGDAFVERCINPLLHCDVLFNATRMGRAFNESVRWTQDYTEAVIRKRTEELRHKQSHSGEKDSFMTLLIKENALLPSEFTDVSIRDEVNTFVIGGHDSTGWATTWATYFLGLHPELQLRVQEEVDAILGNEDRDLTFDEIKSRLPFTEAVVKETLRLHPSIPFFTRITETETRIGRYSIPAGVQLIVNVIAIHRDPNHWTDPHKFLPDRFLVEERNPFSFVPFSAGVRNCIGQKFAMLEMKALIAILFRKFRVTSLDHRDAILVTCSPAMKTRSPIRVRLENRRRGLD